MPEAAIQLNQVLPVIDQLNPMELAHLERRLAARHQAPHLTEAPVDLFAFPFDQYLSLSQPERDDLIWRAYQTLDTWIAAELNQRKATWLLVCGGKVLESSASLRNYPDDEKLMAMGQLHGLIPFVFVKEMAIEESSWSTLPDEDFYPTLSLTLAAADTQTDQLANVGIEINADFDTGSPSLLLDYDQLLAHRVVQAGQLNQAHYHRHLGQVYQYHYRKLLVGVLTAAGTFLTQSITTACIRNWRESPLCLVNPQREALAGRNLLLEFPLRLELDGATKCTRVL